MLSEKDLDDLLDEAIEDFEPEAGTKAVAESSRPEHLSGVSEVGLKRVQPDTPSLMSSIFECDTVDPPNAAALGTG